MSEPIQSIAQKNYILATQQEVSHDNTLSGNGTVESPLGVAGVPSDLIVITEEIAGTYSVNTSDVNVSHDFSKTGYIPIAWTYKFGNSGFINFNQEDTNIYNGTLHFQGYARRVLGSGAVNITVKVFITWLKV